MSRRNFVIFVLLYTAAFGLILVNNGVYWDDWSLYDVPGASIMKGFTECGFPWLGCFLIYVLSFEHSILVFRVISFLSFMTASLAVFSILRSIEEFDQIDCLWILLLFALYPVNFDRIALINSTNCMLLMFFFVAFWLTTLHAKTGKWWTRALALVLFFVSFSLRSLLVFYAIVLIYLYYVDSKASRNTSSGRKWILARFLLKNADFLSIPFVFFILKNTFFQEYGQYAGYYGFGVKNLLAAFGNTPAAFYNSFFRVIDDSIAHLFSAPAVILVFSMILFMLVCEKGMHVSKSSPRYPLLLLGLIAFFLAVYPYLVLDKMPAPSEWNGRHQILVPLGASLMIYYGMSIVWERLGLSRQTRDYMMSLIVILFLFADVSGYLELQRDWFKQRALILNFRKNEALTENDVFLFDDRTRDMNAKGRQYRYFEYMALLRQAFGDGIRFGEDRSRYPWRQGTKYTNVFSENRETFVPGEPSHQVTIRPGTNSVSLLRTVRYLFYQIVDPDQLDGLLEGMVEIDTRQIR